MRNKVATGDVITFTATEDIVSGQGVVLGSLFGVASIDAKAGEPCVVYLNDVYTLPKLDTADFSNFSLVYWDKTNKQCVSTASGNMLIGAAIGDAPASTATVNVRLSGVAVK